MRDIKFRAWDTNNSFMVDENYSDDDYLLTFNGLTPQLIGIKFDSHDYADVEKSVLMQFTGLKDINGVDIYEGDLLEWELANLIMQCIFSDEDCAFTLVNTKAPGGAMMNADYMTNYAVIGNIHQNPELLKENNNA